MNFSNLYTLNVAGKGGYDAEICKALGLDRVSAEYYDGVDPYGCKIELKKQSDQQWIDLAKLAFITEKESNIPLLFVYHDKGEIQSVYMITYKNLIQSLNIPSQTLEMAGMVKLAAMDVQIKYPVKKAFIVEHATMLWKRPQFENK